MLFRSAAQEALTNNELAIIDPLTGLLNRRGGEEQVRKLIQTLYRRRHSISDQHRRSGESTLTSHQRKDDKATFFVAIVDLDHFKKINDTYGHLTGDEALKHAASLLATDTRPEDILYRFGGEEFVFIAQCKDSADSETIFQRKLNSLRINYFRISQEESKPLLASIGFAEFDPTEGYKSYEAAFQRADARLYMAKNNGRNQVVGKDIPLLPQPQSGSAALYDPSPKV